MTIIRAFLILIPLFLLGCSNFEQLRREKFEPDYATKSPTIFISSLPDNGRFVKRPLGVNQPLMLLKKGLGYSVYQLYGGRVGEVPNTDVRPKKDGESFEPFYDSFKPKSLPPAFDSDPNPQLPRVVSPRNDNRKPVDQDEELIPILNGPIESIEPELPEW
jgi:hypothetical protein